MVEARWYRFHRPMVRPLVPHVKENSISQTMCPKARHLRLSPNCLVSRTLRILVLSRNSEAAGHHNRQCLWGYGTVNAYPLLLDLPHHLSRVPPQSSE